MKLLILSGFLTTFARIIPATFPVGIYLILLIGKIGLAALLLSGALAKL
jgi:hypothetical protein